MLRNPVDRAYSHFQMAKSDGYETTGSFEEAIDLEPTRVKSELSRLEDDPDCISIPCMQYSYVERGKYANQLKRYLKYFEADQIFMLQSERLFQTPEIIIQQLGEFLGLEDLVDVDFNPVNAQRYEKMNEETRESLLGYFKPYNDALIQMTGQKFDWDQ